MDLWSKIATADANLPLDTSRLVFVNTAERGKLELWMYTNNRNVMYRAVRHYRQGCTYICFCGVQDVSHLQITVLTQQGHHGPYTMHDFQTDTYANSMMNVSLYANNCSPRADALTSETMWAATLQTRGIPEELKFQCRNEPGLTLRFRFPPVRMVNVRTGEQFLSCKYPGQHGALLDYHLEMNTESD